MSYDGFIKEIFYYTAFHRPTGITFQRKCEAVSRLVFLEYINSWNHSTDWFFLADDSACGPAPKLLPTESFCHAKSG